MRTESQNQVSFTDVIFVYPILFSWIYLVVVAVYACFSGEPMVFERFPNGTRHIESTASRNTSAVIITLVWHLSVVGAHFLVKILSGKALFEWTAYAQSFLVLFGAGLCLALDILGPKTPWLTYALLLGLIGIFSLCPLYVAGHLGQFQGDWVNRLYRQVHRKMHKTRRPVDSGLKLTKTAWPTESAGPARQVATRITLADIFGNEDIKQRILTAAKKILDPD